MSAVPGNVLLEICVDCLASIEACQQAGVPRIELCAGLVEGGTTPSAGLLSRARSVFGGRIMVMIRPRGGDFVVSAGELAVMVDDIQAARDRGADGVVFGCLLPDGRIDLATAERLCRAADGLDQTFHRAFDVSRDLGESLESLVALGIPRVLTSGGRSTVAEGTGELMALHDRAAGRISLLVGGGLNASDLPGLWRHGLREFHLSGRVSVDSPMVFRRPDLPMGAASVPGDFIRRQADPGVLSRLLAELRSLASA